MKKEVKELIDNRDINRLKYIFVDALDVDPTFDNYIEIFNCCKENNIFERYVELTPFVMEKADWNEDYWSILKDDLLSNFSDKRIEHMREVAKVVLYDKYKAIVKERENNKVEHGKDRTKNDSLLNNILQENSNMSTSSYQRRSKTEQQAKELEEYSKKLAQEYNRVVEQEKIKEQERHRRQKDFEKSSADGVEGSSSKKYVGAAAAITAAYLIIRLIFK